MQVIESDILEAENDEVFVAIDDDGLVTVHRIVRGEEGRSGAFRLVALRPSAAHELGNKLRLAAKKAGR